MSSFAKILLLVLLLYMQKGECVVFPAYKYVRTLNSTGYFQTKMYSGSQFIGVEDIYLIHRTDTEAKSYAFEQSGSYYYANFTGTSGDQIEIQYRGSLKIAYVYITHSILGIYGSQIEKSLDLKIFSSKRKLFRVDKNSLWNWMEMFKILSQSIRSQYRLNIVKLLLLTTM